jgi:hypothetical protein
MPLAPAATLSLLTYDISSNSRLSLRLPVTRNHLWNECVTGLAHSIKGYGGLCSPLGSSCADLAFTLSNPPVQFRI